MQTRAALAATVDDVRNDQSADTPKHESFARHPIHVTAEEASHLHEVAEEGESAETFPIVAGVVLAFILPLVATLIALAFVVSHFA